MVEELKKLKNQTSLFSTSKEEDIGREYTDRIPSPELTPSPNSNSKLKAKVWVSVGKETHFPQETDELTFGTKII